MARSQSVLPVGRRRTFGPIAAAYVCAAAVVAAGLAQAQDSGTCGAAPSPQDAMRRLNELRVHGATCRQAAPAASAQPLTWSDTLAAAALQQARDMALLKRMSHRDRENRGLAERLRATGYAFSAAAENVAVGYPSFDDVLDAWLDSEGHCENVMDGKVLEFGVACVDASNSSDGGEQRYWTLVLGAPARPR